MGNIPVMPAGSPKPLLDDIASLKPNTMPGEIDRYNGQRVVSLTANIHGITLGEAAPKISQAVAGAGAPPRGVTVATRGEIPALEQTISGLRIGLLLAVAVIFLLLSANFQSVRLALAIILTIPAVLCGVLLMLRFTATTLNIQSFMGAIMAIGIAVANSILLVTLRRTRASRESSAAGSDSHRRGQPSARHPDDGRRDDFRHAAHGRSASARADHRRRRSAARSSAD